MVAVETEEVTEEVPKAQVEMVAVMAVAAMAAERAEEGWVHGWEETVAGMAAVTMAAYVVATLEARVALKAAETGESRVELMVGRPAVSLAVVVLQVASVEAMLAAVEAGSRAAVPVVQTAAHSGESVVVGLGG